MMQFRSNGKLLLTGEYLVLCGAKALALPLKFGQVMSTLPMNEKKISWVSKNRDGQIWFEAGFDAHLDILHASDQGIAERLQKLLLLAREWSSNAHGLQGHHIETQLEFEREWGWGSSSTLIDLIAQWSQTDPFALARAVFPGSGYDIACARSTGSIQYWLENQLPKYHDVNFNPDFKDNIYFVYTGLKKDTQKALTEFDRKKDYRKEVESLNLLTEQLLQDIDFDDFCRILSTHEELLASVLKRPRIGVERFNNFLGEIKSLGAWGGDYILAATQEPIDYVQRYFQQKSLSPILPYREIVLERCPTGG